MKRTIPALLAILLLLLAVPAVVQAHDSYTNSDGSIYDYSTNSDGSITIDSYIGPPWVVTIPTTINSLLVTSIGDSAFEDNGSLASVTIPTNITSIGALAFIRCSSLTSVTIPNSITSIGEGAFAACTSLTNATIGNSVTSIGGEAFESCASLTSITIPDSVTNIGVDAFNGCSGLTNATIGNGVTSIGNDAFNSCTNLTSITIPNSVISIGADAFNDCSSLTNATIGNGVTSIGDDAFYDCPNLASVNFPNSVTNIGEQAFDSCTSLTSVTIPNSVTSVGDYAFDDCSSLTNATIGNGVTGIGDYAFDDCSSLSNVTIGNGVTSIGFAAFNYCSNLTSVTIPGSVTSIGDGAFSDCLRLTNVAIPSSVTSIGDAAFQYCYNLASVTIPNSVTNIGFEAFEYCTSLPSVTIPASITSIQDGTFEYCTNLTNVTIPNSVTNIGDEAFAECTSLTSVYFEGSPPIADSTVFSGDNNAKAYYLPGTMGWGSMFAGIPAVTIYTVTVSASPANGGTVGPGVTNDSGSTIIMTATNNPGYVFTGWTSNGILAVSTTNYTFTLSANVILVANFSPSLTVAVSNSPANGGTVSGGGTFASNSIVGVTATAAVGYALAYWTQGLSTNVASTSTNYMFTLTSNVTLIANFVLTPPHIEVFNATNAITNNQTAPVNFGSVELGQTGPAITFTVTNTGGLPLILTNVTAPSGYTLNTNPPSTITNFPFTIDGATNGALSAGTFSVRLNPSNIGAYPGSINISNNDPITNTFSFPLTGMVTPVPSATVFVSALPADGGMASVGGTNGGGVFPLGSTNAVLATANSGFEFIGWTGDATGTENPLMVTVNTNLNITANFAIITNFTLTVVTNGEGKVTPNPDGKLFKADSTHTLTAVAASGNVFSNWTGSITTNKNPLTIKLMSSIVLQANFITNPFLPYVGTYNGLFWATNDVVAETNAGMLKALTLTSKGTYSGTLIINGAKKGFSGSFNLAGQASKSISLGGQEGNVEVEMMLTSNNPAPQVTGTVSNANWVATNLTADRATNTPISAKYTLLIPPDTNNTSSPGGYGYALITGSEGTPRTPATVNITGALADGTAFSQSVPVSLDGYVPIYANLYSGKGLLLGWINLEPFNASGMSLAWVHPTLHSGLFKGAFTSTNEIMLSPWTNPPASSALPTNIIIVDITGNTFVQTNDFTITITNSTLDFGRSTGPAIPLRGSIAPKTGLLKLTIASGASKITGYGVILLNATNGGGYFVTKTNAGAVLLEP